MGRLEGPNAGAPGETFGDGNGGLGDTARGDGSGTPSVAAADVGEVGRCVHYAVCVLARGSGAAGLSGRAGSAGAVVIGGFFVERWTERTSGGTWD